MARVHPRLSDVVADLVVGSCCLGCRRAGLLCPACAETLPDSAWPAWPTPTPPGLAPPWTTGEYAGLLRAMIVGHKEDRMLSLRRPLATLVATAVDAAVGGRPGPVALVPVPSRPATVRARAYDATGALAASAAGLLRGGGLDARVHALLASDGRVMDQSGLGAVDRFANLEGSLRCSPTGLRRLRAWAPLVRVVVVDDVLTTGATAWEAQRALGAVGLRVGAIATAAATRRRWPGGALGRGSSADRLSSRPVTD